MDNTNLLQLIMSDGVFSLELLALFAIGFYLIISIAAYPKRAFSMPNYSNALKVKPAPVEIGFSFATIVGVGSVLSPARTWLKQDTRKKF